MVTRICMIGYMLRTHMLHVLEVCSFAVKHRSFETHTPCSLTGSANASVTIGVPHIPSQKLCAGLNPKNNSPEELCRTSACQRVQSKGLNHQ